MSDEEDITFNLWTRTDLGAAQRARGFLDALRSAGEGWAPEAFGPHEPLRRPKGQVSEAVAALWADLDQSGEPVGHILFRTGRGVGGTGTVYWNRYEHSEFNTVSISLPSDRYQADVTGFWRVADSLFLWAEASYGKACAESEFLAQHRNPRPGDTLVGVSLGPCITGVYFANFFGPELVSFFGEDGLDACPAVRNMRLKNGSRVITTADSPDDWDTPKAMRLKAEVRRHLGEQVFFDLREPDRPSSGPFEAVASSGSHPHARRSQGTPVSETIFESEEAVRGFLHDVIVLSDQLGRRVLGVDFDYTPGSLMKVEDALSRSRERELEEDQQRLLEVAAFFGEVLTRNLSGEWILDGASNLPAVRLKDGRLEHPIIRALKFYEDGDLLSEWYDFVSKGGESLLR